MRASSNQGARLANRSVSCSFRQLLIICILVELNLKSFKAESCSKLRPPHAGQMQVVTSVKSVKNMKNMKSVTICNKCKKSEKSEKYEKCDNFKHNTD